MKFNGVVITGGTIVQNNTNVQDHGKGFTFLKEAVASSAFHDSGERFDPPRCHPNTRVAVIERIMDWIMGKIDTDTLILWLYGPAGAGKSAIAQTIAELCHEAGLLLATFFFSSTDPSRNHVKSLISTLAYKIVFYIPAARPHIEQVVEDDPLVFKCSLETQFTRLILEPLNHLFETGVFNQIRFPPVIIIDGLDECLDNTAQRATLEAFARAGRQRRVPLKFLIASRAEQIVIASFKSSTLKPLTYHFPLNNDYKPDEDIRIFLLAKFEEIMSTHPLGSSIPSSWPSEANVTQLVAKSSGQFIYASIAIRFTSSLRHNPCDRLNIVLGLRPPRRDLPFVELDALYTQILSSSEDVETLLKILGNAIVLSDISDSRYMEPLPRIEKILDLEPGTLQLLLGDINSLVELDSEEERIIFHHASFPDFLLDVERSRDLHIDASLVYSGIARWALRAWKDPDIHLNGIMHIARHFESYCQFASPTPELQKDFWELPFSHWTSSMAELVGSMTRDPMSFLPPPIGKFSFAFLLVCGLKKVAVSDIADLLAHHHALLDQYMTGLTQDRVRPTSLWLFLLLGTGRLTTSSDWSRKKSKYIERQVQEDWQGIMYAGKADTFQEAIMDIFCLPREDLLWERQTINRLKYRLSKPWNPGVPVNEPSQIPPAGYDQFLFDFFSDPRRTEGFRFNDHRYAELAITCMRYLCNRSNHDPSPDPRLRSFVRWARKSRNSPWVWRRLKRKPLLDCVRNEWQHWRRIGVRRCAIWWDAYMLWNEKRVIDDEHWDLHENFKHRWADASDRRSLPLRTFALALHLLPQLLAQSPKSEQLMELLSRAVFHPTSVFFVHRTRRAKEAINMYVERINS